MADFRLNKLKQNYDQMSDENLLQEINQKQNNVALDFLIERYKDIELIYYDENGNQIIKQLHGFFARLIQHECEHLDGIVFLERVKEKNGFATIDNINKYNLREK